jgi:hypothetical protein
MGGVDNLTAQRAGNDALPSMARASRAHDVPPPSQLSRRPCGQEGTAIDHLLPRPERGRHPGITHHRHVEIQRHLDVAVAFRAILH